MTIYFAIGVVALVLCVAALIVGLRVGWPTPRQNTTTPTSSGDALIGANATVVADIPANGYGEVNVPQAGHPRKLNAKAAESLPTGTPVTVTDILSPTSVRVRATYR